MATLTQHRLIPWSEVMGADGEKIFAFGGIQREYLSVVGVAGSTLVDGAAVPEGAIWVLEHVLVYDATTVCTIVGVAVNVGGSNQTTLLRVLNPPAGAGVGWDGHVIMVAGDNLRASFTGSALGDAIRVTYSGYKMIPP